MAFSRHTQRLFFLILMFSLILNAFADGETLSSEQLLKLLPHLNQPSSANQNSSQPNLAKTNSQIQYPPKSMAVSQPVTSATSSNNEPQADTRLWNLNNVDIRDVIQEISRETGKNFIIDPRVQGKITIVSSTPMNAKSIYQVFLSTLQVLGYSAIPSGQMVKIIPNNEATQQAGRVANYLKPGQGDEIVVRIIPLKNVSEEQLLPILRPLIPQTAIISGYAPSNILIVAGGAQNIARIAEIITKVDTTNVNGMDVIPLNYALAQDVVNSIQQLTSSSKSFLSPNTTINIAVDDRSNSILLSGNQNERLKLKVLISQLDTPNQQTGNTEVVYLHYLKAQDLVPILAGVAQSYYHGPVGTVIGTKTQSGIDYAATSSGSDLDSMASGAAGTNSLTPNTPQSPQTLPGVGQSPQTAIIGASQGTNQTSDTQQKPKVEIIAEPNTNAIILNAPPTLLRTLKSVIMKLDYRPAQILVEALIAEVDQNTSAQLGIQWGAFTQANQTGINDSDATAGFRAGIGILTGKGLHDLQGVITAIGQDQNSNILSTPSVMVLDNHQAKIIVGQEVSIQQSAYPNNASGTAGATPFTTFGREQVALHLYVTPQIDRDKTLLLSIDQGNNTLQDPQNTSTTPIVNISSIKTSVLVNSGDILVLGGLKQNQLTKGNNGIPLLKDIPGLGDIFKVNNHSKTKKELLVFIRPVIIYDLNQGITISNSRYNDIRQTELNWFKKEYYQSDYKEHVLAPYKKPPVLPTPFSK